MYPEFTNTFERVQALPCFILSLLIFSATEASFASTVVLDFEGFPDSTLLTTQYPSLTFTNAVILTVGISLNEFEFPPHSGVNVASDNGGPMSISFSSPILSLGGYFTYADPLILAGFDALSHQVATATSAFSNNEALSGVPGSSPNEFMQVAFASGISRVTITGDLAGGSFGVDDLTYSTAASNIPEPTTFGLLLSGGIIIMTLRRRLS